MSPASSLLGGVAAALLVLEASAGAVGSIAITPLGDDGVNVTATASGLSDGRYRGILRVVKSGSAGRVQSSQSRDFRLDEGESAEIAKLSLNIEKDSSLSATLEIFEGDTLIWLVTTGTAGAVTAP